MSRWKIMFVLLSLTGLIFMSCSDDDSSTEPTNKVPECNITTPADSTMIIKGDTLSVVVNAFDEDGVVSEVKFYLDEILISSISTSLDSLYSFKTSTDTLSIGIHEIKALALDNEGEASSDTVYIEIDMIISFPDDSLETRVREVISKTEDQPIYASDVWDLEQFQAGSMAITDITGIEYFTGLSVLQLPDNQITDISAISGLNDLNYVEFSYNQVSDITPLSGIGSLEFLYMGSNNVSDLSPLSDLSNLIVVYLADNQITDISSLSGLSGLISLTLNGNPISDLSPVSNLQNLTDLGLESCGLTDLSQISGLTKLTQLLLGNNQLESTDLVSLTGLTSLTNLYLAGNQISDLSSLTNLTNLQYLYLLDNDISDITPLTNLTNIKYFELRNNLITDIYPLVQNTGLTGSGDTVNLKGNPLSDTSIDTYIPELTGRGVYIYYP